MKIRNCVNCGKTPKRDYQQEKLKAIDPGQWDSQSWRNHLAQNQMELTVLSDLLVGTYRVLKTL